jgi:putative transposase
MPQSLVQNLQHTVFSTKGRLKMIEDEWEQELYSYIGGILNKMDCRLISAGGTADHIHMLSSLNKKTGIPDVVMKVKSSSSAWIHNSIPGRSKFAWQRGYASFSVSESQVKRVFTYIENQAEHHHRRSFQEELRFLLDRHRLKYDERYLWD